MLFLPQKRALNPQCRWTPVSTIRWRFLTSCPVSRLAGTVRTKSVRSNSAAQSQERIQTMATCPEDPETKCLCSHSETWPCVFRRSEAPGGWAYYRLLHPAIGHCQHLWHYKMYNNLFIYSHSKIMHSVCLQDFEKFFSTFLACVSSK